MDFLRAITIGAIGAFVLFAVVSATVVDETSKSPTTTDTLSTWVNGYVAGASPSAEAFKAGYRAGLFEGSVRHETVEFEYFSMSATPDSISKFVNRGWKIFSFGTKSSTTGKIAIRGMKPKEQTDSLWIHP